MNQTTRYLLIFSLMAAGFLNGWLWKSTTAQAQDTRMLPYEIREHTERQTKAIESIAKSLEILARAHGR